MKGIGQETAMLIGNDAAAVCDQVLACMSPADIPGSLLRPMAELVDADTAVVLDFGLKRGEIALNAIWSHGMSQGCDDSYRNGFFRSDPMVQHHMRGRLISPASATTAVFPVTNLSKLCRKTHNRTFENYYENFVKVNDVEHMLILHLALPAMPDRGVVIAFHRARQRKPFDKKAVGHLQKIASAVRVSLGTLLLSGELERERLVRNALASCLEEFGVAVIASAEQVMFANENALRHWLGDGVCQDIQGKIMARLAGSSSERPMRAGDMEVTIRDLAVGCPLPVRLVLTSQVITDVAIANRCQAFGLTERETEVASLIADGLGNPEIAITLNISVRTVENHLRAIFTKLEVENRQRMMRVLLTH